MIKKIRIKFIVLAMLSLLLVLAVVNGSIFLINYRGIVDEADAVLTLLQENGGLFPNQGWDLRGRGGRMRALSPELAYETRFFSVAISADGSIFDVNTEHIAAVDADTAVAYARAAMEKEEPSGVDGMYRYLVYDTPLGRRAIFLDRTNDLTLFRSFRLASIAISLAGLAVVLLAMIPLSGRIVRPISESYEKQRRFITDAGHELKTPITIIDADAEVLEMESGENEWLQDIRLQTKRLASLTGDLIYLSRMDEEQTKLQTIDFPLSDVVSETAQSFQSLAVTQNKTFAMDVESMLTMHGDEKAIRQLVSILLDNALKYSPERGTITLDLHRRGKGTTLTVTNTAANLEREDMERLFDRFYRADSSRNSETGGYGLGLSIARSIVTAHKGKITARSSGGASLTIEVSLPG